MREFGINDESFEQIIDFLVGNELVFKTNDGMICAQHCDLFLKREDPLFLVWKELLRKRVSINSEAVADEDKLEFTVLISCSQKVRKDIQQKILQLISHAQELVSSDCAEELVYLGIDFYPLLEGKNRQTQIHIGRKGSKNHKSNF